MIRSKHHKRHLEGWPSLMMASKPQWHYQWCCQSTWLGTYHLPAGHWPVHRITTRTVWYSLQNILKTIHCLFPYCQWYRMCWLECFDPVLHIVPGRSVRVNILRKHLRCSEIVRDCIWSKCGTSQKWCTSAGEKCTFDHPKWYMMKNLKTCFLYSGTHPKELIWITQGLTLRNASWIIQAVTLRMGLCRRQEGPGLC